MKIILLALLLATSVSGYFQGVNLGGWFVLERFIVPSFFTVTGWDEWSYTQYYKNNGDASGLQRLRDHWATWIQESDWIYMKSTGINAVRIPVGYWAMATQADLDSHNEPYITGQWPFLVEQLKFAKKYGIACIIDLHGAPGSQNGYDNSGHIGEVGWGLGDTMDRTYVYLEKLAQLIQATENDPATSGAVIGLELLNEANTWLLTGGIDTLKQYYLKGYDIVRKHLDADRYYIIIESGFQPWQWYGFMPSPQYKNVIFDAHIYQCFDVGQQQMSYEAHLQTACVDDIQKWMTPQTLPTIVGEWSASFKIDSGKALTEAFPDQNQINFMRAFVAAQQYASISKPSYGWFYWTLKTENHASPMWDYQLGVQNGWITTDQNLISNACAGRNVPAPRDIPLGSLTTSSNNTPITPTSSTTSSTKITSATPSSQDSTPQISLTLPLVDSSAAVSTSSSPAVTPTTSSASPAGTSRDDVRPSTSVDMPNTINRAANSGVAVRLTWATLCLAVLSLLF